jgi:hypothetical protein
MADLGPVARQLREHIDKMDKMSGKDFAILVLKALEDIDRRVSALERMQPLDFNTDRQL